MKPCKEAVDAIKKILAIPQEKPKEGLVNLADEWEAWWEDVQNGRGFEVNLHILLDELSPDVLSDICAVMLTGRGDYKTFDSARAREVGFSREETIFYITGKTLRLKAYLTNGLKIAA